MSSTAVEIPDELLDLLMHSRLGSESEAERVRTALAMHLFQEELVSLGRAAELAGMPRVAFEQLLVELGIPVVRYDLQDYEADLRGVAEAERHEAQ